MAKPLTPAVAKKKAGKFFKEKRWQAAQKLYSQLCQVMPDDHDVWLNLGISQNQLADLQQAEFSFRRVLDLRPNSIAAYEQFQKGWAQYEWRQKHPARLSAMDLCEFSMPRWDGSSLTEKTILVYTEQGFGDALQFGRYLQVLNDQGARIIFYCNKELVSLFQCLSFLERVEAKSYHKALKEQADFHIPLTSLPHLCGATLENIPSLIPYLRVAEELNNYWKARIQPNGLRVGVVWAGRSTHLRDSLRSCGLRELLPLLSVENVSFYSLQKGEAVSQIKSLSLEEEVTDLSEELNDFSDTAAVINNLDIVITVDTSVAHLAGALGCQVWTLIYSPPEWRWMLDRDDSPWYPTMRLFRQSDVGGWEPVIGRVASALAELAAESLTSK